MYRILLSEERKSPEKKIIMQSECPSPKKKKKTEVKKIYARRI